MKIGPLFKWFGSKWQSAKRYPSPYHQLLIEPFAGSAGYALNYVDSYVIIWDTDPHLAVLWPWLIGPATSQDVLDIPLGVKPGTDIRTLGLNPGQMLLLKNWQRTNNVGDCWTISAWGNKPGQWTAHTRSRIAEEIHAVKHWRFMSPNSNWIATWYIDPPYQYNYRYDKRLPAIDYAALTAQINAINPASLVIVCEATDKQTGAIPDYLPFKLSHSAVTSRRNHSNECIYVRHGG